MRKDVISIKPIYSSFLSCEIDAEKIIKTLFVDSRPYSDKLKRLLIINKPDCLDQNNQDYQNYASVVCGSDQIWNPKWIVNR